MHPFKKEPSPLSLSNAVIILITFFVIYWGYSQEIVLFICEYVFHHYEFYILIDTLLYGLMATFFLSLIRPLLYESRYYSISYGFNHLKEALKTIPKIYLSIFILNTLILLFTGQTTSANQAGLNEFFMYNPIFFVLSSCILAPVVEEIVFRGVLFRQLRPYGYSVAILVSSLSFGLAHVFQSLLAGNWLDGIYIITYSVIGYLIGKNYERSGSIFPCFLIHFLVNSISTILIFIS